MKDNWKDILGALPVFIANYYVKSAHDMLPLGELRACGRGLYPLMEIHLVYSNLLVGTVCLKH